MVDKVARTSQQREATKARIVGSSDKSGKSNRAQTAYPKIITQKGRKNRRQKKSCC